MWNEAEYRIEYDRMGQYKMGQSKWERNEVEDQSTSSELKSEALKHRKAIELKQPKQMQNNAKQTKPKRKTITYDDEI